MSELTDEQLIANDLAEADVISENEARTRLKLYIRLEARQVARRKRVEGELEKAGRRIEQQKATIKSLNGDVERAYDIVKDQRREIEHLECELCKERDRGTETPF